MINKEVYLCAISNVESGTCNEDWQNEASVPLFLSLEKTRI
jgi:hypothetical protein